MESALKRLFAVFEKEKNISFFCEKLFNSLVFFPGDAQNYAEYSGPVAV